jgi:hypothetical protein
MCTLLHWLDIQSNLTSAYHPQSNGQTERANQKVEKYLHLYASHRQDNWDTQLPSAEFAYTRAHSAYGQSPFEVVYGYLPPFRLPVGKDSGIRGVDEQLKRMKGVQEDVEAALRLNRTEQKES